MDGKVSCTAEWLEEDGLDRWNVEKTATAAAATTTKITSRYFMLRAYEGPHSPRRGSASPLFRTLLNSS